MSLEIVVLNCTSQVSALLASFGNFLIADVENEDVCDMILTADQAAEFTTAVTQQVCVVLLFYR
jgi:hypothetical protein